MNRLLELLQPGEKHHLWIDGADYCERLLAAGSVPWMDISAGAAWLRKSQQLLQSDVIELDVFRLARAFCAARPELPGMMRSRQRLGYALRVLLADAALRSYLSEWVEAAKTIQNGAPLCLRFPSPPQAVAAAWQFAHGSAPSIDPDDSEIDMASLYLADFLRTFGALAVDAVLLEEGQGNAPAPSRQALYQSSINVALNYRWAVGLDWPSGASPGPIVAGIDYVVADSIFDIPSVVRVESGFWSDEIVSPSGRLLLLRIPADAQPELVLQKLAALRAT